MRLSLCTFMILIVFLVTGCSGNSNGAGHWFHILFVILPLGIFLYIINRKLDYLQEAVSKLEDKLSSFSSRIDKDQKAK